MLVVMDERLWLVALGLLIFGVLYAYRAAVYPVPIEYTWVSVVLGTSGTNIGISIALWIMTGDWRLVLLPWVAYAITGLPNILSLSLKYRTLNGNAAERVEEVEGGEDVEEGENGDQA